MADTLITYTEFKVKFVDGKLYINDKFWDSNIFSIDNLTDSINDWLNDQMNKIVF